MNFMLLTMNNILIKKYVSFLSKSYNHIGYCEFNDLFNDS